MRVLAYAKINLGLRIVGRRPDGFHEIETIFQTIDLSDDIRFEVLDRPDIRLRCESRTFIPLAENLVYRAAQSLSQKYGIGYGVSIHVRKRIPVGAGLGGGSSDAGCALMALRKLWNIPTSSSELHSIASALGSDVPFFLHGGTGLGRGRGAIIEPMPDLKTEGREYVLLLVCPNIHVSTAEVYGRSQRILTDEGTRDNIKNSRWERFYRSGAQSDAWLSLSNDLEDLVFPELPELEVLKKKLLAAGAIAAAMSGSGSTVFGIFENRSSAEKAVCAFEGSPFPLYLCNFVSRALYQNQFS
jgi:4-diphosphocytidyl-2-C-methyl-D-erythritol kinase